MANLIYLRSTTSLTPAFTPASLFASGEEGAWYEPSTTTAFKSTTDLTPCGYGDGAGFLLDKSKGAGYSGGSFTGLGSETVTNGAFSTDLSGWTTTAWVWDASGRASLNTTTNFLTIRQNLGLITGKFYLISFDYEVITGSGQIGAEGTNSANILFGVGSGSIEFVWQVPATGSTVFFRNLTATTEMYIDNISVRELPGNHATQVTADARPFLARVPEGGRRNELSETDTLATQSVTVTAAERTLSFKGTGTVTLSGASTAGPLIGTGADDRVDLTFTPSAGSLTLTVLGTVTDAQLGLGSTATNYQSVADLLGYDITEAGVTSLEYLSFDGSDDVLSRASFAFTEELSFFGAYSDQCSMSQSDLSSTRDYIWSGIGGSGALSNIRDSVANDLLSEAVSGNGVIGSIFEGVATGGAYALRVNGTETDTGTATATPSGIDTFSIGALLRDGSAYLAGGFYGGVAINRILTTDEITNTEAYLATRSGVTI